MLYPEAKPPSSSWYVSPYGFIPSDEIFSSSEVIGVFQFLPINVVRSETGVFSLWSGGLVYLFMLEHSSEC